MQKNQGDGEYLLIGLTGSIGAGKSQVADLFRKAGIPVLSADAIAKELMQNDPSMKDAILREFGKSVYSDGRLDRKRLAELVFNDHERLQKLSEIVHPRTIAEQGIRAKEVIDNGASIVVCEAALIYESGGEERFDYIVVVDADVDLRFRRAAERDGVDVEEIRKRDAMQIPAEEKVRRADVVIKNNGNLEELQTNTELIVNLLQALPPRERLDGWEEIEGMRNEG